MASWDSVWHVEAARAPYHVPTFRGRPERQIHDNIRPLMQNSRLHLERIAVIALEGRLWYGNWALNTFVMPQLRRFTVAHPHKTPSPSSKTQRDAPIAEAPFNVE